MRVAINLVKHEVAQACVSAGNTGALMANSRFVLKTLPGSIGPAIAAQLPTRGGGVVRCSTWAPTSTARRSNSAVRGDGHGARRRRVWRRAAHVGLLNVGEEEIKGNELAKEPASC
jgi:glycerol-3-phosphate acyltransferase PlsX